MWEKIKEILAGLLLIPMAGWILWHLVLLYIYSGQVTIVESSKGILIVEMIAFSLIALLGIERVIRSIKSGI